MRVITDPTEWADTLEAARQGGSQVGLVPTMGALHDGHLSLIRRARADCATVAVTNYVNPLQFGANEDLAAYPRDLDRDVKVADAVGADLMFAPSVEELWPFPSRTTVHVAGLTDKFEGEKRPGHFDGVATIVTKLLSLAGRCYAYFGEKDFQQLTVIRRLVEDLSLPVFIVGCPIVRTTDGLALSSRNSYLSDDEMKAAPALYWALLAGKRAVEDGGEIDPDRVRDVMASALARQPLFSLDYAAAVDPETFAEPPRLAGEGRLIIAARIGKTRLLDNLPVNAAVSSS